MGKWSKKQGQRQAGAGPAPRERVTAPRGASHWRGTTAVKPKSGRGGGIWLARWVLTLAVLVGVGYLIYVILNPKHSTPIVVLSVEDFASYIIPPRPGATQEAAVWKKVDKRGYLTPLITAKTWLELENRVKDPTGVRSTKDLILFSIAAQGVVNFDGKPCLLDTNSDPFDEKTWIPLGKVLATLHDSYGSYTKAVLFLDSGSHLVDWPMGILVDEFSNELKDLLKDLANEKGFPKDWLTIVHSRGSADLARVADQHGRVIFADLLHRGLAGEADTDNNQEIWFNELRGYLRSRSSGTLEIWPKDAETNPPVQRICYNSQSKAKQLDPLTGDVPRSLADRWHFLKDELSEVKQDHLRRHPWKWAQHEWAVLRAERAWLAGCDEIEVNRLADKAKGLGADLARSLEASKAAPVPRFAEESPQPWQDFFQKLHTTPFDRKLVPSVGGPEELDPAAALAAIFRRDADNSDLDALKQLLLLRRDVENAVDLDDDFRAEALLRNGIESNDLKRRALEDLAILGSGPIDTQNLRDRYDAHRNDVKDATVMLAQRDVFLAEMPWLFRWAETANRPEEQSRLVALWNDGIDEIKLLEGTLKPKMPNAPPETNRWQEIYQEKFETYFLSDQAERLSKSELDDTTVNDALGYLSTPLVSGATRLGLLAKLVKHVPAAPNKHIQKDLPTESITYANCLQHPFRTLLLKPGSKFDRDGSKQADVTRRRDDGQEIRQEFADREKNRRTGPPKDFLELKSPIANLDKDDPFDAKPFDEFYNDLIHVDGISRTAAMSSMSGGDDSKTFDRFAKNLAEVQRGTYLHWRGERAIADFYGPLRDEVALEKSYFLAEAQRWIGVLGQDHPLSKQLQNTVNAWKEVDGPWLELSCGSNVVDFGSRSEHEDVTLKLNTKKPRPEAGSELVALADLEASIARTQVTLEKPYQWTKRIPRDKPGVFSQDLPLSQAYFRGHRSQAARVQAVGSEKPSSVTQQITVAKAEPAGPATVLVKGLGDDKQHIWIVVVLDCSASMMEVDMTEGGKNIDRMRAAKYALTGNEDRVDKFGGMIKDLLTISEANNVDFHVGLIAYGYRRGILRNMKDPDRRPIEPAPRWANLRPLGAFPQNDPNNWLKEAPGQDLVTFQEDQQELSQLEMAFDVGRLVTLDRAIPLNRQTATELRDKIQQRIPIGETPLHLGIIHALKEIKRVAPAKDQRMVVVLTDGVHDQRSLGYTQEERMSLKLSPTPPRERETTLTDLKKEIVDNANNISFKIIGFGKDVVRDQKKLRPMREFFDDEQQKREFHVVKESSEDLAETLRFDIRTTRWRLLDQGNRVDEKLGTVERLIDRTGNVNVQVVRKSVRDNQLIGGPLAEAMLNAQGGERFKLLFDEPNGKGRLRYHRYWGPLEGKIGLEGVASVAVSSPQINSVAGWEAAATSPRNDGERSESGAEFRIAFRPTDTETFPARPILDRAILRPRSGGQLVKGALPYFFEYGQAEFATGTEVPVLQFNLTTGWKKEWDAAELRLWMRLPGDSSTRTFKLLKSEPVPSKDQTIDLPEHKSGKVNVTTASGEVAGTRTIRVDQWRVLPDDVDAGTALIVRLDPPPEPLRISYEFVEMEQRLSTTFLEVSEVVLSKTDLVIVDPGGVENNFAWTSINKGNR